MVTYDLRGHGNSDKPFEPERYKDSKAWADELQAVMDATGVKRPVLAGAGPALVTLAAVTFPTRVHGTYTAFTAPFLIATACLVPSTIPSAAVMLLAATLQILSWQWANLLAVHVLPDEQSFPPARQAARRVLRDIDRPREWALTLVSLGATAGIFATLAGTRRRDGDEAGGQERG